MWHQRKITEKTAFAKQISWVSLTILNLYTLYGIIFFVCRNLNLIYAVFCCLLDFEKKNDMYLCNACPNPTPGPSGATGLRSRSESVQHKFYSRNMNSSSTPQCNKGRMCKFTTFEILRQKLINSRFLFTKIEGRICQIRLLI